MPQGYASHKGEFQIPATLLPELSVDTKTLKKLGQAGLLFMQVELRPGSNAAEQPAKLVNNMGSYTSYRYHADYAKKALTNIGENPTPRSSGAKLAEFGRARTGDMADAINRFYAGIFVAATPDETTGLHALPLERAQTAMGLSYHKIREYSTQSGEGKSTWYAERLAEVYAWNIPGGPEAHNGVRQGLGDLALQYTIIVGEETAAN